MAVETILWEINLDTTTFEGRLSNAAKKVTELQGAERKAHLENLGMVQRLKVEIELLRKVRDASHDPKVVEQYTTHIKGLVDRYKQLTGVLKPLSVHMDELKEVIRETKGRTIFDVIRVGGEKSLTAINAVMQGVGFGAGMGLVGAISAGTAAVMAFGKQSLAAATNAETTRIAFETMLGSKEKAAELQAQIITMASKTPFELTELNDYTKQLMAMGVEQESVVSDMTSLGNVAAGVGKDKLPQLVNAFGKVRSQTKLTGETLNQFSEAGVPLLETLAKQAGKTTEEIQKSISNGAIKFEDVRNAFQSLTGEGGKFFNLMEKQSKTLDGQLSNLSDSWNQMQVAIGEKLMPTAKDFVGVASDIVNTLNDWVSVPLSEKIAEEQSNVNALVGTIVSVNDNYQLRNQLLTELVQTYPDFLGGLSAEIVTNDELIQRLEQVNELYRARTEAQFASERATKLQEKARDLEQEKFATRMELIKQIDLDAGKLLGKSEEEQMQAIRARITEKYGAETGRPILDYSRNAALTKMREAYGLSGTEKAAIAETQRDLGAASAYAARTKQNELEKSINVETEGYKLASRSLDAQKEELRQLEAKLKTSTGDSKRVIESQITDKKGIISQAEKELEKQNKKLGESRAKQIEGQILQLKGEILGLTGEIKNNPSISPEKRSDNELEILKKQDEINLLRSELNKIKAKSEPKTSGSGGGSTGGKSSAQSKAEQQKREVEREKLDEENRQLKLAELRKKLREDSLIDLTSLNASVKKIQKDSDFESIQNISERVNEEVQAEKLGAEKKRSAIALELAKTEVVRKKGEKLESYNKRLASATAKFEAEATAAYAPVFAAIEAKGEAMKTKQIDVFKEKSAKIYAENERKITELTLQAETERLNLLTDSLEKENAIIANDFEKRKSEITYQYENLRKSARENYDNGLLSIAENNGAALEQSKIAYENYISELAKLENDAQNRLAKEREKRVLQANQTALEKAQESARNVAKATENEYIVPSINADTQRTSKQYLDGEITYEEYQKKLTDIQKYYEQVRQLNSKQALEDEISAIQKRVDATESLLRGEKIADPSLVLNGEDLKKAKSDIQELKNKISELEGQQSKVLAESKKETASATSSKVNDWIKAYESLSNSVIGTLKQIEDAEMAYYDRSIEAQKARIEQAKTLRDRGNASYLEEEEKRLSQIEEKRRRALARQQFLDRVAQLSSVAVGVAKAFADAPAGPAGAAIKIAASLSALAAAYGAINSIVPQRFFKGTKSVKLNGSPKGIDTIPSLLTEDERVVDRDTNRDYRKSLDIIHDKKLPPKEALNRLLGKGMNYAAANAAVKANIERQNSFANFGRIETILNETKQMQSEIRDLLSNNTHITNVNVGGKKLHKEVTHIINREAKRRG